MKTIILSLISLSVFSQPDTSQICSMTAPQIINNVSAGTLKVWGTYIKLNNVNVDTLGVWAREYIDLNPTSSAQSVQLVIFHCTEEMIAAALSNANGVAFNQIIIDILKGMLSDVAMIKTKQCVVDGPPDLESDMNVIKFKGEQVMALRDSVEANMSGLNLDIWNSNQYLNVPNAQEIINLCDDYLGLLQEPCLGTAGTPLDIRLGGRCDFLTQSIGRLLERHEDMGEIFKP